jgi:hypothetical protein
VRLLVFLVTAAVATPLAAAALTTVGGGPVASGSAAVTPCDADGFGAGYSTSGGAIIAVAVSGIAAGCDGAAVRVAIVDAAGAAIATGGPEPVTGDTVTVPVGGAPSPTEAQRVEIVVEGP